MVMKPKVSIIIPTYNNLESCLKPCVESIIKNTDLIENELIIVANGCKDGTIDYVNSLDKSLKIKLIEHKEPLGYTKATNLGILNAEGDYLVFLNNDTILLDQQYGQWLKMLLYPFKDSNVGITGPLVHASQGGFEFVVFFCAATTRKLIYDIGILDESFSPGGAEDIDFCIRAYKKGYICAVVPDNKLTLQTEYYSGGFPIFHKAEATVHGLSNWEDILNNNYKKVLDKHGYR